jgi:hypothetical protein
MSITMSFYIHERQNALYSVLPISNFIMHTEIPCSTHLPVIPTYRSAKKEIPHTKCPTLFAQCLAKIEVVYMEQIVSY